MAMKAQLLEQFEGWVHFLEELTELDWNVPLAEGKWTIHDVVSHMYLWDQYFLEEAIIPISKDTPLTVQHLDFDAFNKKAMEIGSAKSKREVTELSRHYRQAIVREIRGQDEQKFSRAYVDGDGKPFVVEKYLRDFLWHDQHHMNQIESWRAARNGAEDGQQAERNGNG